MHFRLRIRNADQVVQVTAHGEKNKRTVEAMNEISILEHATVIVGDNGKLVAVGPASEIAADPRYDRATFDKDIDGTGLSIVPGLVDAHTHPVWAGDRVGEFAMKLAGATYMDIHKMGRYYFHDAG